MKKVSRLFCGVALSSLLCLGLSSCQNEEVDLNAPVTIDYWYGYPGAVDTVNKELVEEFNKTIGKEKNITVVATAQSDIVTTANQLSTAIQGGTQPDVVALDTVYLNQFLEDEALESLDQFVKNDNYDMTDFYAGLLDDSYYNDSLYSLPYLKSTPVLYVNKDLLTNAGLTEENLKTWDGFFDACVKIAATNKVLGTMSFPWTWMFEAMMQAYGTSLFNDDFTSTNLNSSEAKDLINKYLALKNNNVASIIPSANHTTTLIGGFAAKKVGMFFYSTGGLTTIQGYAQKAGIDLAVCPMPKGTVEATVSGGANLVMPAGLSEREKVASWEFIKYLTSKEVNVKTTQGTGYLPTRKSVSDDEVMKAFYEKNPMFKIAVDQLNYATGKSIPENATTALIKTALEEVWISGKDVNATLSSRADEINKGLKK